MAKRLFLVVLLVTLCKCASGQLLSTEVGPDSIKTAFVPVFGYSSDVGFLGGVLAGHYDYRGHASPFNQYIEISALASTKGFVAIDGTYEKIESFGTNIRSKVEVDFDRKSEVNFFGIGNNTTFEKERWENGYYYYKSIGVEADYQMRKPVSQINDSQLDVIAGLGVSYHIPYVLHENSVFNQVMPYGSEGGWTTYLNTGLVWENRDNEFDPRQGNHVVAEIRYAPSLISEYGLAAFRLDLRQYLNLFSLATLAVRVEGRHTTGDVPFWELPTLGDASTLRGYPLNRFKGNSSISYNFELRSWLIGFDEYKIKLGGQVFTDMGRVFTAGDELSDFFKDYKQTFGIGGAISMFSPDFILRGDIGFSEDVSRIYVGIGYIF